jgi:hypothetical protein
MQNSESGNLTKNIGRLPDTFLLIIELISKVEILLLTMIVLRVCLEFRGLSDEQW